MPPKKPEEDIANDLATQLSLTVGQNIFARPVLPPGPYVDHKAVFVFPSGGVSPLASMGETTAERISAIQIRVRGDERDFDGGLAFARSVRDTVHYSNSRLTDYIDVRVQSTEPINLGEDEEEHPEWSINVEAVFEE